MKQTSKPPLPPWPARRTLRRALKAHPELVGVACVATRDRETGAIEYADLRSARLLAVYASLEGAYAVSCVGPQTEPTERFHLLIATLWSMGLHPLDVAEALRIFWEEREADGTAADWGAPREAGTP